MKLQIGEAIRLERTRLDLTQDDLAKAADVTAQTISNWETGKTPIPAGKLIRICGRLGLRAADVIEYEVF